MTFDMSNFYNLQMSIFKKLFAKKEPTPFLNPSTKQPFVGITHFYCDEDTDHDFKDPNKIHEIFEIYVKDSNPSREQLIEFSQYSNYSQKKFINERRNFYDTFPCPESIVENFEENLCCQYISLIIESFRKGPTSWIKKFIKKGGHNKILDFFQKMVQRYPKVMPLSAPDIHVHRFMLYLCSLLAEKIYTFNPIFKDNPQYPTSALIDLFFSLFQPIDYYANNYCLKILNHILTRIPKMGNKIVEVIESIEKSRGISDFFRLISSIEYSILNVYSKQLFGFIYSLTASISYYPAAKMYIGYRLYAADYLMIIIALTGFIEQEKAVNPSKELDDFFPIIYWAAEFIKDQKKIYDNYIGTALVNPRSIERSYLAMLPNNEFQNTLISMNTLLSGKPYFVSDSRSDLHVNRLFLEYAWLIGHKEKSTFIPTNYILSVMKMARLMMICLPDIHLVDLLKRAEILVHALKGNVKLNPIMDESIDWNQRSNFFSGDDFFGAFTLLVARQKFIPKEELNGPVCQTLTILLNSIVDVFSKSHGSKYFKALEKSSDYDSVINEEIDLDYYKVIRIDEDGVTIIEDTIDDSEEEEHEKDNSQNNKKDDKKKGESEINMIDLTKDVEEPEADDENENDDKNHLENNNLNPMPNFDGPPPPPPPPPPPMPGSGPGSGPPKKPNPKPPVKTRQLFWTKIPDMVAITTLWKDIDDSKVKLGLEDLLELFIAPDITKKPSKANDGSSNNEKAKPQKKTIMQSAEKYKNISIMLRRLGVSPEVVFERIQNVDTSLSESDLLAIKDNLPTTDDLAPYHLLKDPDLSLLDPPDLYLYLISKFPLYNESLDLIQLNFEARGEIDEYRKKLNSFKKACEQLENSESLKFVLTILLRIGNILNGGGPRGGAYGFKLSAISKVINSRAAMPGETLLSYLIRILEAKYPSSLIITEELSSVPEAVNVDLKHIRNQLMPLKCRIDSIHISSQKANDNFKKIANELMENVGNSLNEAIEMITICEEEATKLIQFFGEDKDTSFNDFFGYVATFLNDFVTVKVQIDEKRAEEEKRLREDEERRRSRRNKFHPENHEQQRGFMDELFNQIKSGKIKKID
ncbi:hypothetical protein TRFO_14490 [Tritrichomonas foetus]|uniref:FH2 domain-containing protein n=1 Tax=Tritrichomonas foetus TaxID=1144522 RepID=A0A1J4KV68_9EUKA|nr:hypothetical protein TRFO_14490 [Tritrichomonas foetus]|eukprot:OHT15127.1 hypothetical protein TRFO_14490 [Tritrichomonas foetus]